MNPRHARTLRIQAMVLIGALVVQYALGMYVNLFVAFPQNATQGQLWEFAWAQWPLATHILLALLILLGGIAALVRAALYRDRRWIIADTVGLLAILAAGINGAAFVPSQTDAYSYAMSLAFLIAFLSYLWGLVGSRQPEGASA